MTRRVLIPDIDGRRKRFREDFRFRERERKYKKQTCGLGELEKDGGRKEKERIFIINGQKGET